VAIEARADVAQRVIFVQLRGRVTAEELFAHQENTISRPEYAGFHEFVDVSEAAELVYTSEHDVRALAALSAKSDPLGPRTRLAIVAVSDLHFGMARMYESFRSLAPSSGRDVGVFRNRADALEWMGVHDLTD
jgi:hypothetical protein